MMVIGLTGGIASGKSTVAVMLRKANIPVIDADDLAREVTKKGSPVLKKISEIFGARVISEDQSLDRKALGSIVFADHSLLKKLEAIVHPEIKRLAALRLSELAAQGNAVAVYMAPLIFETDLQKDFSKTLLITANKDVVMERAHARDRASKDHIQQRISAQLDDATKKSLADYVIENNGSLEELHENLVKAWMTLTGLRLQESASKL